MPMKKIILLTAVMALALLPGLQAGDEKAKEKTACCAASKPEAGKCGGSEGSCCAASCKAKDKQAAKAAKEQAKAEKKAAKAEKKAAKRTS